MSDTYPNSPGFKREGTSQNAAAKMKKPSVVLRENCYLELDQMPRTADEVADILDEDILSVRPRVSELARMNAIFDSGLRRKNSRGNSQIVWSTYKKPQPKEI